MSEYYGPPTAYTSPSILSLAEGLEATLGISYPTSLTNGQYLEYGSERAYPEIPMYYPPISVASLPKEVIDNILKFDIIWQCLPTLKACALVCSAWLPLVRELLFETLVVTDGHPTNNFKAFELLLEKSPGVCYCIRALSLRPDRLLESRTGKTLNSTTLREMLAYLPRLTALEINGLRLDGGEGNLSVLPPHSCLEELKITNMHSWMNSGKDMLDIFSVFSHVQTLRLERLGQLKGAIIFEDHGACFTPDMISSIKIPRSLTTSCIYMASISQPHFYLEVLKQAHSLDTLEAVTVECDDAQLLPGITSDLGSFLTDSGTNVLELNISLVNCWRYRQPIYIETDCARIYGELVPAIKYMPSLHMFTLSLLAQHNPEVTARPTLDVWSIMISMLSALPPTTQIINLVLDVEKYDETFQDRHLPWLSPHFNWTRLQVALNRFPYLEAVRFISSAVAGAIALNNSEWDLEGRKITYYLPELAERGILRFGMI